MALVLDDGIELHFGQDLEEVERLLSSRAINNPSRIARNGIDKILRTETLDLDFDSGRLRRVTFGVAYQFVNAPIPYPEDWKNLPCIAGSGLCSRMPRNDYLSYVKMWEKRAGALGAEKVEMGDLADKQFAVLENNDQFWDAVIVNMGPSRRAGGGGIWCDGWIATFEKSAQMEPLLKSLSAFRDEFNTVARRQ